MNTQYTSFFHSYRSALLEGQREILLNLAATLFPVLEGNDLSYYSVLARMPTGTGKTGVIAIAAYLGNYKGSTLILTPWKNLCAQMQKDLEHNFWGKISLSDQDRSTYLFATNRMLPSNLASILRENANRRVVIVGTLNGLQTLERRSEKLYQSLSSLW